MRLKLPTIWLMFALLGAAVSIPVQAALEIEPLFGSGMVVQRDKPIPLWGQVAPGQTVTVQEGVATKSVVAGADGRWKIVLPARPAGLIPDIVITTGSEKITLTNLLAGDVWLCCGQSNMEWNLGNARDAATELKNADHRQLRLFMVDKRVSDVPLRDLTGQWQVSSAQSAKPFSAVGYFFGRDLQQELNVPIGLIQCCWGGTGSEPWTPMELIQADPNYAPFLKQLAEYRANYPNIIIKYDADMKAWEQKAAKAKANGTKLPEKPLSMPPPDNNHKGAAGLFNGMVAPLIGLPVKGALWSQGESSFSRMKFYRKFVADMFAEWWRRWNVSDYPVIVIQLANYEPVQANSGESVRAEFREVQVQLAKTLPRAGLVTTIDVGEADTIHPLNKQDVGHRTMLAALKTAYGRNVVASGPTCESVVFQGAIAKVKFSNLGDGLVVGRKGEGGTLKGFALAGADKKWCWADANISGDEVTVRSDAVVKPVALRYAWAANPVCNLYNRNGLPAVPFRTDGNGEKLQPY